MISGGLVVHTAGDPGDEARAKSVVAILRDGVTISNSWDLQVNKKRERKKKKRAKAKSQTGEKKNPKPGTTAPLAVIRAADKGARAGSGVDGGGRLGPRRICAWAGRTGRLQRGPLAVQGSPRKHYDMSPDPAVSLVTVPVAKAGKLYFLAGSVLARIMRSTFRKMEGLGFRHISGCSFCWTNPWPDSGLNGIC